MEHFTWVGEGKKKKEEDEVSRGEQDLEQVVFRHQYTVAEVSWVKCSTIDLRRKNQPKQTSGLIDWLTD